MQLPVVNALPMGVGDVGSTLLWKLQKKKKKKRERVGSAERTARVHTTFHYLLWQKQSSNARAFAMSNIQSPLHVIHILHWCAFGNVEWSRLPNTQMLQCWYDETQITRCFFSHWVACQLRPSCENDHTFQLTCSITRFQNHSHWDDVMSGELLCGTHATASGVPSAFSINTTGQTDSDLSSLSPRWSIALNYPAYTVQHTCQSQ